MEIHKLIIWRISGVWLIFAIVIIYTSCANGFTQTFQTERESNLTHARHVNKVIGVHERVAHLRDLFEMKGIRLLPEPPRELGVHAACKKFGRGCTEEYVNFLERQLTLLNSNTSAEILTKIYTKNVTDNELPIDANGNSQRYFVSPSYFTNANTITTIQGSELSSTCSRSNNICHDVVKEVKQHIHWPLPFAVNPSWNYTQQQHLINVYYVLKTKEERLKEHTYCMPSLTSVINNVIGEYNLELKEPQKQENSIHHSAQGPKSFVSFIFRYLYCRVPWQLMKCKVKYELAALTYHFISWVVTTHNLYASHVYVILLCCSLLTYIPWIYLGNSLESVTIDTLCSVANMEQNHEFYENAEYYANTETINSCECEENIESETIVNEYKSSTSAENRNTLNGQTGNVVESSKSNDNIYNSKDNDGNNNQVQKEEKVKEEVNVAETSATSKEHNNLEVSSDNTNYSTSEKFHIQIIAAQNAERIAHCYAALDQRQQLFIPFLLLRMELVLLKFALIFIIITCFLLVMESTRSAYIATPQLEESFSYSSILSINVFAIMKQKAMQWMLPPWLVFGVVFYFAVICASSLCIIIFKFMHNVSSDLHKHETQKNNQLSHYLSLMLYIEKDKDEIERYENKL